MNLQNIISELEKVDGEVYDRLKHVSRRHLFSMFGRKAAAVAAPTVLASALTKAYGEVPDPVIADVLNFALTLEYLEAEFYNVGMDMPGLIPAGAPRVVFTQIRMHENAHVNLLKSVLGSQAVAKPRFDFTAKGTYPDVFKNYNTFLTLSQAFEDTGVRAYKGQAPKLMSSDPILTTALQIHSVEARHAARVREMRGMKGWITGNMSAGVPPAVYAGDEAIRHLEISALIPGVPYENSTEAWDEPLSKEDVLKIVMPFLM
ncbi:ferritin-like domain-containing protein [Spirosoma taeanense]|uniref:Ferritin-like domain-containing protein n=1 Tax=Spirosoma taeanense TaxID=2735870 RepID=A0A6M5Y426_9BACT|nr:ferritin-like domain-containing protein [Spirosoma taeanense]QJW88136.1 ferritin-like domain-containing protein [Spirosoma taeanense]